MHLINKMLITGTSSGFGKYFSLVCDHAITLTRENRHSIISALKKDPPSVIVHCAFNSKSKIDNHYQYFDDNLLLTKELCEIPHVKFIYLSSVDVYREENSMYKYSKILAESIVKEKAKDFLILRCSAIVGPTMRYNTFLKILKEESPTLTLNKESTFNYVSQEDLSDFILESISNNMCGTYDFTSQENISLLELSKHFHSKPLFGEFMYKTPEFKEKNKLVNKTSLEVAKEFRRKHAK